MIMLGKRIREAREYKALLQRELAEILYVNQTAISRWERGVDEPSAEMIVKIAKALDCDPNYLLGFGE